MRKLKIMLTFAFIAISSLCLAQGINFEKLSFDEAVAKAKESNKLVFLDCYTTWCGPCKYMSDNVFVLPKAGEYFNPRYVNIKIDMEKGEGPELAKRLGVKAYPTFIVADDKGEILVKFAGGVDIDTFIKKIEDAQKTSFTAWESRYQKGTLTTKEKIEYIGILSDASEREAAQKLAEELLNNASKKEKLSKEFWPLFGNNNIAYIGNEHFNFLVKNKKKFDKIVGKRIVDNKLYYNYFRGMISNIYGNFGGQVKQMTKETIENHLKTIEKLDISKKDLLIAQCKLALARADKNAEEMAKQISILLPAINDSDLWGYGSSFITVFETNPEAKNIPMVKEIGRKFVDKANTDSKKYYISLFNL